MTDPTRVEHALRNPGTPLELSWLEDVPALVSEAERQAADIAARAREVDLSSDDLLLAIELLDLTTLSATDTEETVRRLCQRAVEPIPEDVAELVGATGSRPEVAAVCVFDRFVPIARASLSGHAVRIAAVTGGFPFPHQELEERAEQVASAIASGADEVDVVIDRDLARTGNWIALFQEVRAVRDACGPARIKVILAAGDLGSLVTVGRASLVCCMAGADFIKTSTGREKVNATLPIGVAMAAAIRSYSDRSGHAVGLKAAGGIRTAREAGAWLRLVRQTLGPYWVTPERFRIGASSLLDDLERSLRAAGEPERRPGPQGSRPR